VGVVVEGDEQSEDQRPKWMVACVPSALTAGPGPGPRLSQQPHGYGMGRGCRYVTPSYEVLVSGSVMPCRSRGEMGGPANKKLRFLGSVSSSMANHRGCLDTP